MVDTHGFLGKGALDLNTNLKTITTTTIGLFDRISDGVVPLLCAIISPFLHTVVITGSGKLSFTSPFSPFSERNLDLFAAKFIDPSLAIGDSKVKLRILYNTHSRITAYSKRFIDDQYHQAFHILDRSGRLEVQELPREAKNGYSPFEVFQSDIRLA